MFLMLRYRADPCQCMYTEHAAVFSVHGNVYAVRKLLRPRHTCQFRIAVKAAQCSGQKLPVSHRIVHIVHAVGKIRIILIARSGIFYILLIPPLIVLHDLLRQAVHLRIIDPLRLCQKLLHRLWIDLSRFRLPERGIAYTESLHDALFRADPQQIFPRIVGPQLFHRIRDIFQTLNIRYILLPAQDRRQVHITGNGIETAVFSECIHNVVKQLFLPFQAVDQRTKICEKPFFYI